MLIVAIAWIYVVGLMAITETSVIAGIMTFLLYCVLPLSVILYIASSGRRRRNKSQADLWVSIQKALGIAQDTFGEHSSGGLTELRSG